MAVGGEIAIHPSEALFLLLSVEQVAQTGMKHTQAEEEEPAKYSGSSKDKPTLPVPVIPSRGAEVAV